MKRQEILEVLNNPEVYSINKIKSRTSKNAITLNNDLLSINLNGEYYFNFCNDIEQIDEEFIHNFKSYDKILVPSNIEFSNYGQIQYVNFQYPWDGVEDVKVGVTPKEVNYCGQYAKQFNINLESNNKYYLEFEGVESCFHFWINGEYVGYSEDSFTSAEFNITDYLINGTNDLYVEVYKFSVGSWLNDQDFWRLSGIFRDVKINVETEYAIWDYDITYDVKYDKNTLKNTVELEVKFIYDKPTNVHYELCDRNNGVIASGETNDKIKTTLLDVKLWNPENPYLYTLKLATKTEKIEKRIGFKKLCIDDGQILLNSKKMIIKGVNRHEFHKEKGRALSYEDILGDLQNLKKMNINAIRTSHYPNNKMFYDLCDQLGFIVMDEVNLETHGTWAKQGGAVVQNDDILPNDNKYFRNRVLSRAENMYFRDRNYSCICFWSLGNESFGGKTLNEMYDFFKSNDKNRLVHYEGISLDNSFTNTSDILSRMYTSSDSLKELCKKHSQEAVLLCEFSHAMGNSNGDVDDYVEQIFSLKNFHGGFIWEYKEHLILTDGVFKYGGEFGDRPSDFEFICDGIVSDYCFKTPEYYYISRLFSPINVYEDSNYVILRNTNMFESIQHIRVDIIKTNIVGSSLFKTVYIEEIKGEYKLEKIKSKSSNIVYKIYSSNRNLASYSLNNKKEEEHMNIPKNNVEFVDGDNNFGLICSNYKILFSKVKNNLISLKYKDNEVFENINDVISPNFYRAVTNNDMGANKHKELSVLKYISYDYSTKILNYNYNGKCLAVEIEFTHPYIKNYKAHIKYEILNSGKVDVSLKVIDFPTQYMFNFGIKASLSKEFSQYYYLGNGPYDSYSDRKKNMSKAYYFEKINRDSPYIYPQEFGNKTDVDCIYILNRNKKGVKIGIENGEFSLKGYSDLQLDENIKAENLKFENPFLRLNKVQSGVGGEDSWGRWCKDKYIVKFDENMKFSFSIELF